MLRHIILIKLWLTHKPTSKNVYQITIYNSVRYWAIDSLLIYEVSAVNYRCALCRMPYFDILMQKVSSRVIKGVFIKTINKHLLDEA